MKMQNWSYLKGKTYYVIINETASRDSQKQNCVSVSIFLVN